MKPEIINESLFVSNKDALDKLLLRYGYDFKVHPHVGKTNF